jgi:hypothetical protein
MLEVYRLLAQWFLQRHEALAELDLSGVANYQPHPVPVGCKRDKWVEFWADELGRLLEVHKECGPPAGFSVAVACEKAFAGEPVGRYDGAPANGAFPLIGRDQLKSTLVDAYEWEIDRDIVRKHVSLKMARENCFALGQRGSCPRSVTATSNSCSQADRDLGRSAETMTLSPLGIYVNCAKSLDFRRLSCGMP